LIRYTSAIVLNGLNYDKNRSYFSRAAIFAYGVWAKIVQVFHAQQAITFDNPRENYYQFTYNNKVIGIDTGAAEEQSISLFVDEQFATQLALPAPLNATPKKGFLGLAALGFKLFKSAKIIKVVLAGASVAGYAWLFSIEFALMLIGCLVVHEYMCEQ